MNSFIRRYSLKYNIKPIMRNNGESIGDIVKMSPSIQVSREVIDKNDVIWEISEKDNAIFWTDRYVYILSRYDAVSAPRNP